MGNGEKTITNFQRKFNFHGPLSYIIPTGQTTEADSIYMQFNTTGPFYLKESRTENYKSDWNHP